MFLFFFSQFYFESAGQSRWNCPRLIKHAKVWTIVQICLAAARLVITSCPSFLGSFFGQLAPWCCHNKKAADCLWNGWKKKKNNWNARFQLFSPLAEIGKLKIGALWLPNETTCSHARQASPIFPPQPTNCLIVLPTSRPPPYKIRAALTFAWPLIGIIPVVSQLGWKVQRQYFSFPQSVSVAVFLSAITSCDLAPFFFSSFLLRA